MTQPGTTAHEIPRGDDWIARSIADIYRKLRRLGSNTSQSGGGPIGAVWYSDPNSHSDTHFFVDPSSLTNSFGDTSWASYNSSEPAIQLDADGWYVAAATGMPSGTITQTCTFTLEPPGHYAPGGYALQIRPGDNLLPRSSWVTSAPAHTNGTPDFVEVEVWNPEGLTWPAYSCGIYVVRLA